MTNQPKHILLAEDDPALAAIIHFNLKAAGFHVTVARNGCEAWEYAQHNEFDLVLTDYGMPRMMGSDLSRQLRQDDRYARTPIILMTAFSRDLDLARLRDELHLAAIYSKPFSPSELMSTVKQCLADRQESAVA